MATIDVSVIGELNLDIILSGLPQPLQLDHEHLAEELSVTLGSSSAIFAHNLASLGSKVGFSSCIGADPLGETCLQRLRECGVDLSHVRRLADKITGLTVVLRQAKQRFIFTYPGTMAEMTERDLDFDYVFGAKHLHVSSYFLQRALQPSLPEILRKAKEAGLTTSLDTNDDPEDRWSVDLERLLRYVDVFLPSEREGCKLACVDDVQGAAELLSTKVPILVIKRGSEGALARRGKMEFAGPPLTVEAVDAVGAGDSFDAGFIHQFLRGASLEDCVTFGNVAGALCVTRAGGTEAFRDVRHRETFLRKHAAGFPSWYPQASSTGR